MQDDIYKALEVLKKGGVILYPTDTIWGIGCDATNADAVKKVYEIKQREESQSMIVLIEHDSRLPGYVDHMPDVAYDLIDAADKPLTLVLSGAKNLSNNVINQDGSIGIRIPKDPFCQKLLQKFRKPIVSTSANIHGESSPQRFDDISEEILSAVDYVVEWRQDDLSRARSSSIIKIDDSGVFNIIRH